MPSGWFLTVRARRFGLARGIGAGLVVVLRVGPAAGSDLSEEPRTRTGHGMIFTEPRSREVELRRDSMRTSERREPVCHMDFTRIANVA